MSKQEIFDRAIGYLNNLPKKYTTSVVECFAYGSGFTIGSDCSFQEGRKLIKDFEQERKKRGIKIHLVSDFLPIGLPWCCEFYKI